MSKDDGGKVFPGDFGESSTFTIRDYFAAKAMQSFVERAPNGTSFGVSHQVTNWMYASAAYSMADAMIEVRKK